jgi:tetratricopeptide (TPR) repeat protein
MGALAGLARRRKIAAAGALRRRGDAAGAIDSLAPVLADAPEDPAANVEMARALQLLEDFAGAEEHYRRALREQLDFMLVIELAGVVGGQGRVDEANDLLDAALQIAEQGRGLDAGEAHFMRAMVAAGNGRADDARAALALIGDQSSPRLKEFASKLAANLEQPA